jgi:hypothetical protein
MNLPRFFLPPAACTETPWFLSLSMAKLPGTYARCA